MNLTPLVRILLTGLAAAVGVIASTQDSLPLWAQALIVGASTILAGLGIIPPQVKTETVARRTRVRKRDESGQSVVGVIVVLLLAALVYWLLAYVFGLPVVLAVIAAILVALAGLGSAGRF